MSGCLRVVDPVCGDGFRDAGEQCDDGNLINGDGCSSLCFFENDCGNRVVEPGEGCDDGNLVSGDGCSASCLVEANCGDGFIDAGEGCDDGNNVSGDGCSATCMLEATCGNGRIDAGEECDDGGRIGGDGCSADCLMESTGYLICNNPGMCGGRDDCFDVDIPAGSPPTFGSMCTHLCANDGECMPANGFTGACYALDGAASICYQRCDFSVDCYVGNVCISVTLPGGIVDGVCVPDNAP